jgi:hypothetical protein
MTRQGGGDSVNKGPAPGKAGSETPGIVGNAGAKGQDPSPDDRDRGEASDADSCTAHDRAS